ncbi:SCO family protein [Eoetvoesiella caeni]|uniref:Protein SCO1/2 n=1 Tax=Eoetvoesiella caeni TaxID=645616 RepID=A0A366H0E3_9BURK|nr:SCO family protein [Eoetvoesiella caeni]MCI2811087.1 SCO family protein [Eoetvoesiella caeni]NYT57001.1 SCO family protein [Eoetvoesiella caeni]RBP35163.1 protein SCO1/2 [Eoetvoesiella caeni]
MKSAYGRSSLALVGILCLGLLAFAGVTSGFAAVTADSVRRVQLERAPRTLPPLELVDADGGVLPLSSYGTPAPKVTFVTLVYLQCQSICRTSVAGQSWMQHAIQSRGLEGKVQLLTLSFDPANDTPDVMADYARRMGAAPELWQFATVRDQADLPALLKLFDIIILPDGLGGYSHNAALFLIDETGRLSKAYDIDRPDLAMADYLAAARVETRR